MISRLNRLLIAIILVGFACYAFYLNPKSIEVNLGPDTKFSAPLAIILMTVFAFGVLCTTVIAVFFGVKAYFREKGFLNRERAREQFYKGLVEARGYLAAEEYGKAQTEWQKIVNKDPTNIIARIELSKALEKSEDLREALKVVDAARAAEPGNVEVLFRAAELNLALNNRTAAIDNLALLLYSHPSARAARMARTISEELNRIEDALEYQDKLTQLSSEDEASEQVIKRLQFKRIMRDTADDRSKRLGELRSFVKCAELPEAFHELSELEAQAGNIEDSAKLLFKAGRLSGNSSFTHKAANLWLKNGHPDRAVATAKAAIAEAKGEPKLLAALDLIRLYLTLNMAEDAKQELARFDLLLSKEGIKPGKDVSRELLMLRAYCFLLLNDSAEALRALRKLSESDFKMSEDLPFRVANDTEAPAARLSTP